MGDTIGVDLGQDRLVLTRGRDFKWSFQNLDDSTPPQPIDFPPGELFFELQTRGETNAKQHVEVLRSQGGSYSLSYGGVASDPIDYYEADDAPYDLTIDVRSALENIPAIGVGNVLVTSDGFNPVWHLNMELTGESQNEIQLLTVTNLLGWLGEALGEGKMILSYRGNDTEPISFESSAATIQAALETIPQIGVGNVSVTEATAGHFHIEFINLLAARDIDQITVSAYKQNADDFFGGGITANLLTRFSTSTIQNGRQAILNGRMMSTLTDAVNQFFALFDDSISLTLSFDIDSTTKFTVVCKADQTYQEVDLITFDVLFTAAMVLTFFNNLVLLNGAITSITVDHYWNYGYSVEFVNEQGNLPQPLLVGDASNLTNTITEVVVTPAVQTSEMVLGQPPVTKWPLEISGDTATLVVESEYADLIADRVDWQLVWLPEGETSGGDAVAEGTTKIKMPKAWVPPLS